MNVNKLKMVQVLPREVSVLTLLHFSKYVNRDIVRHLPISLELKS